MPIIEGWGFWLSRWRAGNVVVVKQNLYIGVISIYYLSFTGVPSKQKFARLLWMQSSWARHLRAVGSTNFNFSHTSMCSTDDVEYFAFFKILLVMSSVRFFQLRFNDWLICTGQLSNSKSALRGISTFFSTSSRLPTLGLNVALLSISIHSLQF